MDLLCIVAFMISLTDQAAVSYSDSNIPGRPDSNIPIRASNKIPDRTDKRHNNILYNTDSNSWDRPTNRQEHYISLTDQAAIPTQTVIFQEDQTAISQ